MVDAPGTVEPAEEVRLTEWTSCGGCAAKWGAALLTDLVRGIGAPSARSGSAGGPKKPADASLLIGLAPFDDAAIYKLTDDIALVSTTDFFPPLVDDPGDFGAIAAANACSDVFAMGGRVLLALNVAAFPETLPREAVAAIFEAAAEVVGEAGGTVAGGHTIRSEEPIFGLAVQGVVHPERVLTKRGARPGDVLVLSKPIGTGIVLAGGGPAEQSAVTKGMRSLNRSAAELLTGLADATHAVTDITGYGLAGHGWEMAERSSARLVLDMAAVPLYPGALDVAATGTRTGGDGRNREYVADHLHVAPRVTEALDVLAHDPQTSGGLLAAIEPAAVARAVDGGFVVIGQVEAGEPAVELR